MYLLDTDICSYLTMHRYSALGERLRSISPEEIAVSTITEGEAWFGLEWRQVGLRRRLAVRAFYESVRVCRGRPKRLASTETFVHG